MLSGIERADPPLFDEGLGRLSYTCRRPGSGPGGAAQCWQRGERGGEYLGSELCRPLEGAVGTQKGQLRMPRRIEGAPCARQEWPRLLLFLSETISTGQPTQVTACLKVLVDLVDLVGEELLAQGPQTVRPGVVSSLDPEIERSHCSRTVYKVLRGRLGLYGA